MTRTPSTLADLLADCDAHGIRLLPAPDGRLTIDARQDALTPDLLSRVRTHKGELLAILRPDTERRDTIRCPWCSGTSLIDVQTGLFCETCEQLAWVDLPTGGIVRGDQEAIIVLTASQHADMFGIG